MTRLLLLKCFVFIFVFFISPRNEIFIKANTDYKSVSNRKYLQYSINPPVKWTTDVMREKVSLTGLEGTEPGFNLTKEEMIRFKIWPQGIIPYYIDDFSFDKVLRDRIRNYLDLTNRATGLRFMELPRPPADEKTRWVLFVNRQGLLTCADHSIKDFTNEGVQKVILGYDCLMTRGELAEAVLALVGVPPQHNSPNRDKYIRIENVNIMPEKQHLFVALKNTEWLFHDVPYDYLSASHYSFHKYSKNGYATIQLVRPVNVNIGEGKGFSYSDIWKIRMLYNFISNKKRNLIKASDCMKLFEPGANFSNYQPFLENLIEPRTKPRKYLGLPEDEVTQEKNKNQREVKEKTNIDDETISSSNIEGNVNNEEKDVVKKDDEEEKNENIVEKDVISKELSEENGELQKHSGEETGQKQNNGKRKLVQLKQDNDKSGDPFIDLEDFSSSSETTKHLKRIFKKVNG